MSARQAIKALGLSAVGLVSIVLSERYTDTAIIPTKNDKPTVGFGSTLREDGSPVKLGDRITPPAAVARTAAHIAKDETKLKVCVKGELSQTEYDVLVDFSYQYGVPATCASRMVRDINAGLYVSACKDYLKYKLSGGFDCSIPGNKICGGVWTRQIERSEKCMEAQ